MKGIFIPEITAEMFKNGCLESIEALMAEGEIYDIEYSPRKTGKWIPSLNLDYNECSCCHRITEPAVVAYKFCPYCGASMTN